MRAWIEAILIMISMWLAFLILFVDISESHADVVELRELSLNYRNYRMLNPNSRDPLLWPEAPKEGLILGINLTLLKFAYWDSNVEAKTTVDQYRSVGLETRLGVNISPQFQLGLYHHSQHLLDRDHAFMPKFPVTDAVELKIFIYRAKEPAETVF